MYIAIVTYVNVIYYYKEDKLSKIKEFRIAKKMTQSELARRAHVSQPHIHDLENGHRSASPETLARIAAALDVTVDDLIQRKSSPEDKAM